MTETSYKHVEMAADVEIEYIRRDARGDTRLPTHELVLTCDEIGEVFTDIARMWPYMGEAEKNAPWKAQDAVDKLLWEIQHLLEEKVNASSE